jgi:aspartyl-tRNA synthetase
MSESLRGFTRSHYCGELGTGNIGQEVSVCGWTQRQRDLGGLIFIDLRDRTGLLQLAFDDNTDKQIFEKAFSVRAEYVLAAKGVVRRRDSVNKKMATGEIEIAVTELRILGAAETPPFEIVENSPVKEDLRLKYRYLDLRRTDMQRNILARHRIVKCARDYFDDNGFVEIETPMLIKSTPEGARDYLVPSRLHAGKFYALPQSPQLYKQLLMLSGFDRYMQIARCFRDEDLRADRQPEFTQIDLEMSFADENSVMEINEGFAKKVFHDVLNIDVPTPFTRLPYARAMELYGSDKPDTRFEMTLCDISDTVKDCGFKVFDGAIAEGGSVRAICAKGAFDKLTRKELDKLAAFVKDYGAKGLAWTRLSGENTTSSFAKFLTPETAKAVYDKLGAVDGDVIMVVADTDGQVVFDSLGALRLEVAGRLGIIPEGKFNFLWVTEFPLFEYSREEGRYMAKHHPFTMPADEDLDKVESHPGSCRAIAYDMVLNGVELGGGSVRINNPELQKRMFAALGFTPEKAQEQFGFLMNAYKYGAPPHAGMAYGLDRLCMLMLGCDSIRDVIAFPKVQNASELMSSCPEGVEEKQLSELHIEIANEEK